MDDEQPKKSWWGRLNEKPEDWDTWRSYISRWVAAIVLGLVLLWLRLRH